MARKDVSYVEDSQSIEQSTSDSTVLPSPLTPSSPCKLKFLSPMNFYAWLSLFLMRLLVREWIEDKRVIRDCEHGKRVHRCGYSRSPIRVRDEWLAGWHSLLHSLQCNDVLPELEDRGDREPSSIESPQRDRVLGRMHGWRVCLDRERIPIRYPTRDLRRLHNLLRNILQRESLLLRQSRPLFLLLLKSHSRLRRIHRSLRAGNLHPWDGQTKVMEHHRELPDLLQSTRDRHLLSRRNRRREIVVVIIDASRNRRSQTQRDRSSDRNLHLHLRRDHAILRSQVRQCLLPCNLSNARCWLTIRNSMRNPEEFSEVLRYSIGGSVAVYASVGLAGYLAFGRSVHDIILFNFSMDKPLFVFI